MKVLCLVILLNAQSGDIEKGALLGTAPDSATCMQVVAKHIELTVDQIPKDMIPFPMCIDIEPMIPAEAKRP